jgi:hypothetical protein
MKNLLILALLTNAVSIANAQEARPSSSVVPSLFSVARANANRSPGDRAPIGRCDTRFSNTRVCGSGLDVFMVADFLYGVRQLREWARPDYVSYRRLERSPSLNRVQGARFGIKAGLNLSDVTGSGTGESTKVLAGLNAGLMADFGFGGYFSFHPELLFSEKGAKYTDVDDATGFGFAGRERITYFDLPLLVRLSSNGFFAEAGPQLGYLVAVKNEYTLDMPGLGSFPNKSKSTDREGYRRLDAGYVVGVGYQLPQGLEFGVRYNGGFSDLSDPSETPKLRNSVFQLQVGYLFSSK